MTLMIGLKWLCHFFWDWRSGSKGRIWVVAATMWDVIASVQSVTGTMECVSGASWVFVDSIQATHASCGILHPPYGLRRHYVGYHRCYVVYQSLCMG